MFFLFMFGALAFVFTLANTAAAPETKEQTIPTISSFFSILVAMMGIFLMLFAIDYMIADAFRDALSHTYFR